MQIYSYKREDLRQNFYSPYELIFTENVVEFL